MSADCEVVVVGAGLAGAAAAAFLHMRGIRVVVLEKSRGVGGRAATRRFDGRPVDYGAQFFTVRTESFGAKVAEWMEAGLCRVWSRGFPVWHDGGLRYHPDGHERYCCPAGMTSLSKAESAPLDVRREHKVTEIARCAGFFQISVEGRESINAGAVLLTAPTAQTLGMISGCVDESAGKILQQVAYEPCLTSVWDAGDYCPEWQGVVVENEDVQWLAADGTRRDVPVPAGPFVVHASAEFSTRNLEVPPTESAQWLLPLLSKITHGGLSGAKLLHAHRWRYAKVVQPLPDLFLKLAHDSPLYFAGDAFMQGNFESAWISGQSAAAALCGELGKM